MERRTHLVLLWSIMTTLTLGSPINGPQPMTAVAPVGAMATFTCVVNTTELPGTFNSYSWIVDGMALSGNIDQETTNGSLVISTLQLPVIQDYITGTGVPVQCQVVAQVSDTNFPNLLSNKATLTAYGK